MIAHQLISIITPSFNHELYIESCINSVIAQTYQNWELIIIDDGSTDRTKEVITSFSDHRIKYIWQQNVGIESLAETYNKAFLMASGELIAILEGDDWWPANKLATQVKDFDDKEVVLSYGYTQEVDESGAPIRLIPTEAMSFEALCNVPVGRASRYLMDMKVLNYIFPVSVVIRKSTLLNIGGFQQLPYLPLVDYPTFLQLSRLGKFAFHDEILGFWRRHSESTTRKKFYLINQGVYEYLTEFQSQYFKDLPVSVDELDEMKREWQEFKWYQWFTLGRWFMVDGEWAKARLAFKRCRPYSYNWKHPALLVFCYACCHLQRDIEWFVDSLQLKPLGETLAILNRDDISLSKAMLAELREMPGTDF